MANRTAQTSIHVLLAVAVLNTGCAPRPSVGVEVSFWHDEQRVQTLGELEPFSVQVRGVPPAARVRLHTRLRGFHGWGTYVVDDSGVLDTSVSPALEGTYAGLNPSALVWSMQAESDDGDLAPTELRAEVEPWATEHSRLRAMLSPQGRPVWIRCRSARTLLPPRRGIRISVCSVFAELPPDDEPWSPHPRSTAVA